MRALFSSIRVPFVLLTLCVSMPALASDDTGCDGEESRAYWFRLKLPAQSVPVGGEVVTFVFENLPQLAQYGWPRVRISTSADLGLNDERLYIHDDVDGKWRPLAFDGESDCANPANCLMYTWANGSVADGTVVFSILASPSVNAKTCLDGFIELTLAYEAEQDHDCNNNRIDDACDIAAGLLEDCNENLWADICELARFPDRDCDGNGILDCCDRDNGADDCDGNGKLDRCDIAANPALDCDGDGRLDLCELIWDGVTDVDRNNIPDNCDIAAGRLEDCNNNGVADLIELSDSANDTNGDSILDVCGVISPDLWIDGLVNSADLSVLLALWATTDVRADFDGDGLVGAPDLALLLAAWGPIGLCGDGFADPGENCCNCPQDVGCGAGFDCYYGACLPCPGGLCSPTIDECDVLYGFGLELVYGDEPCYGPAREELDCYYAFFDSSPGHGFAMSMLSRTTSNSGIAVASLSLLGLLAVPRSFVERLKRRIRR